MQRSRISLVLSLAVAMSLASTVALVAMDKGGKGNKRKVVSTPVTVTLPNPVAMDDIRGHDDAPYSGKLNSLGALVFFVEDPSRPITFDFDDPTMVLNAMSSDVYFLVAPVCIKTSNDPIVDCVDNGDGDRCITTVDGELVCEKTVPGGFRALGPGARGLARVVANFANLVDGVGYRYRSGPGLISVEEPTEASNLGTEYVNVACEVADADDETNCVEWSITTTDDMTCTEMCSTTKVGRLIQPQPRVRGQRLPDVELGDFNMLWSATVKVTN